MLKDLYIVSAGGFGRETVGVIERINEVKPTWNLKGFIDNDESILGKKVLGYPIIGNDNYLLELQREVWVVCAIGNAKLRKRVVENLSKNSYIRFATIIDPSVIIYKDVTIGEGTIVSAGSIFTVNIKVGKHVIINLDCTITHDDIIQDFVTLNPSVNVSGNVVVEECVELGVGTQIIPGKRVGSGSIIGAGSVVIRDIPANCTAVGIPAKPIKYFD